MSMIHRFAIVGLVAGIVGVAVASDDPPKTITSGPLSFQVPTSWTKTPPSSS
jgi:hypothetical protein